MFSSMLYRAFKGGERVFHVFCENAMVDPADYEKLAVEMIKFAGELRVAIKTQEDAAEAEKANKVEKIMPVTDESTEVIPQQ